MIISASSNKLLEILLEVPREGTSTEPIKQKLNISNSTLNRAIDELNVMLAPVEYSIKNNWITVERPLNVSLDWCISKIIQNSVEYSLLEAIFLKNNIYPIELSELLFISESSIKRIIVRLNITLKQYNIHINSHPIRIQGDERNIRKLYVILFKEKYGLDNLPFAVDDQQYFSELYYKLTYFSKSSPTIQDENNFLLFTLVSNYRESMGYPIEPYLKEKPFIIKVLNYLPAYLKKKHIINSVYMFFYFSSFVEGNISNKQELNKINEFVKTIEIELSIKIEKIQKQKLIKIINDCLNGYLNINMDDIVLNNYYKFFYTKNSMLIDNIKEMIVSIFNKYFPDKTMNNLYMVFYYVTINMTDLIESLSINNTKVNIGIYINFDYDFSKYIENKLKLLLSAESMNIELLGEKLEDDIVPENYDVFITNSFKWIDMKINNTICISHYIEKDEWTNIVNFIHTIYEKKIIR